MSTVLLIDTYDTEAAAHKVVTLAKKLKADKINIQDIRLDSGNLDEYKLQEYAGKPRRKHSEGKATWPGRKQVYRQYADDGCMTGDIVALEDDDQQQGESLIQPFMRSGKRPHPNPSVQELRSQTLINYQHLPAAMTTLDPAPGYPVTISSALKAMAERLDQERLLHDRESLK